MTVYIEYVILDNLAFTLLICNLSYKIFREKAKRIRCMIASVIGTVCAVFYPFVKNANVVIVFKIMLFVVICVILYVKMPKFLLRSVGFLLCTALIGGVQFMIGLAVFGDAISALKYPVSNLPLSVFIMPPLVLFGAAKKFLDRLNTHRLQQNYIYELKLFAGDNSIKIKGLIDTGNTVRAENDVVFVNSVTAINLLGGDFIKMLSGERQFISIQTAAGNKKIILFPAKIELYLSKDEHIFMDVQVGVSDVKINGEYEAILPLALLGKEKVL